MQDFDCRRLSPCKGDRDGGAQLVDADRLPVRPAGGWPATRLGPGSSRGAGNAAHLAARQMFGLNALDQLGLAGRRRQGHFIEYVNRLAAGADVLPRCRIQAAGHGQ